MVDSNRSGIIWRKSTRSGAGSSNCLEVAIDAGRVLVRDSKDPDGPVLEFSRDSWSAFVEAAKRHEFDR